MDKCFIFLIFTLASSMADLPAMGEFNCVATSCVQVICPKVDDCATGTLMYDPKYPCSCCKYCLDLISENESCNINAGDKECGPGLTCTSVDKDAYKCLKIETECRKAQSEYDTRKRDGRIGMYVPRPDCDDNGEFVGKKCQPDSSCHCIDKKNRRIDGEAPPAAASKMNCECSRDYQNALELGFRSLQFPHCLPNGNYDQLQCVNLACYCIDPDDFTITTGLVPIFTIEQLPCYDKEVHSTNYQRPCEMEKRRIETLKDSYAYQNITILGLESPKCSPDGNFLAIRKTETSTYCVDPQGRKIENYEIPDASSTSNCACARTRYMLVGQSVPLPVCCPDGSYRSFQCRGGVCFCVNTATGDMVENELEVPSSQLASLSCYRNASSSCPLNL